MSCHWPLCLILHKSTYMYNVRILTYYNGVCHVLLSLQFPLKWTNSHHLLFINITLSWYLNFLTVHMHPCYTSLLDQSIFWLYAWQELVGNILREKFTYKPHDFFLLWILKFDGNNWGWGNKKGMSMYLTMECYISIGVRIMVMVINATFNNISVIYIIAVRYEWATQTLLWSILTGQTISVSVVHKLIHAVKATTTHITVVLRWRVPLDHDWVPFIFKHNFLVIAAICKNPIKINFFF